MKLRMLNQPICLFGEDILDRRERLRALLSTLDEDRVAAILHSEEVFIDVLTFLSVHFLSSTFRRLLRNERQKKTPRGTIGDQNSFAMLG